MTARAKGSTAVRSRLGRRDLLRLGGLGLGWLGAGAPALTAGPSLESVADRSVILLLLVGGPSQLETWDPKPDATAEVRGPFSSIATRIPGVRISEHLPRLAQRMNHLAILRAVHHEEAPIHETGCQLLQTGRLCRSGEETPHFGSLIAHLRGAKNGLPPFALIPGPIRATGIDIPHGQTSAWLGARCAPFSLDADPADSKFDAHAIWTRAQVAASESNSSPSGENPFNVALEPDRLRDEYGRTSFGQSCLLARRLVERGVRVVTVNMFETVFNRVSWDCHGGSPFSTLDDYARVLLPDFDRAFSALIDDLDRQGRLDRTLVVAAGEFGRTPKLNSTGGRDHWPGVWSVALAGGGIRGGQVLGASDAHAARPTNRPVAPQELLATIDQFLGINRDARSRRPRRPIRRTRAARRADPGTALTQRPAVSAAALYPGAAVKLRISLPSAKFQSFTSPSQLPEATLLPSREIASEYTQSLWPSSLRS